MTMTETEVEPETAYCDLPLIRVLTRNYGTWGVGQPFVAEDQAGTSFYIPRHWDSGTWMARADEESGARGILRDVILDITEPLRIVEGGQYRVKRDQSRNGYHSAGDVVTASTNSRDQCKVRITSGLGRTAWCFPWDIEPLVPVPEAVAVEEDAEVVRLRSELAALEAVRRDDIARWQADIAVISEHLNEEASSRDWCSDYESIIERINRHLRYDLTARSNEVTYRGERNVQITVTVRQISNRLECEENDDLESTDFTWDSITTDNILAAVRQGSWEVDDEDGDDFEYETV